MTGSKPSDDLADFKCPDYGCNGKLKKVNDSHYKCNLCSTIVNNRENWWELMKVFQRKASVDAVNNSISTKRRSLVNLH